MLFFLLSFLFVSTMSGWAQTRTITGKVVDPLNESVIGANVSVKGTTTGAITDIDGAFSLQVPNNAVLVISYIGYTTQEIRVGNQSVINVTLQEDTQTLDEVVVVGFGTQKKVNLTGSVGIATAEDLEARPVMNATQALQGMVPGLNISTNTGALNEEMKINVRGVGTIGQGSDSSPLILIDGMEGDLSSLNPQDIENISILKDASASSIYGSRAPFGVILVTTKRGERGKATINYNNSFRVASPINLPEMMDSYTFANYFNSAAINSKWGAVFTDKTMQQMLDFQAAGGTNTGGLLTDGNVWGKPAGDPFTTGYANTDWFHEIYKDNNFSQEHNLSLSGGSEKISYYASLGYLNQSGSIRHGDDGLDRYNAMGRINADMTSWLKFNYTIRFARTDNWRPSGFGGGLYERIGRQTWPNMPVYDENGYYHNGNADTPAMALALGGENKTQTDRTSHQAALIFEPIKNWKTNVEFNYSVTNLNRRTTSLPYYNHDVNGNIVNTNGTSSLNLRNEKNNFWNLNIYSEYSQTFNKKHNFKVMGGFQAEEMKMSMFAATGYGLLLEELPELSLISSLAGNGASRVPTVEGTRNEWATAGFFGRINYDYDGKYLAEVNMRYDGTSRFRRESRWDLYPSISLGWNIAREEFWEPFLNTVNTLKLRASYGELGNQNTSVYYPTYRTMTLRAANGSWLQNSVQPNTASIGDLISTALTWETVRSWNVALDWGLFKNRLTGSFDVYTRYTDNMVGPAPELPNTLGIAAPRVNNCDLETSGWELELAWRDRLKNGLRYGVKVMLSDAQSKVSSYPGNVTNSISTYASGQKLNNIWGFETIGIAKTQAEMDAHLEKVGGQSALGTEWAAGDIMYADLDGQPGITRGASTLDDHGDLKIIGNSTPRYHFGLDLSADWKGFDIRAFFQGVLKRDIWNGTNMFWGVVNNQWWSAGLKEHGDYFRAEAIGLNNEIPANLDAYYPRPLFSTSKNQNAQTGYLQDASYIRLKNLQLGYTLPASLTKKITVTRCRIFVSGENLWTGTSLSKLFDPETIDGGNTSSNANAWIRSSGNAYPLSRTWSFGINVTL
ncbi:TonB-dependent receptor [Parabacteroides sp. OttesenSCG-928-O15]|nr:TonB-dependent receptor [Parabacteroides sp. OttesenSCG-928-O15]